MGGRQNEGPFLGTLIIRCRIIRTQKGTLILTTTHMARTIGVQRLRVWSAYGGSVRVWGLI